jgi:hypothetical protein
MGLKLIGEVALDGSGFERGLNAMAGSVKGFIASAFGMYAIEGMMRKTFDTTKDLVTEAQRLGIAFEQLQVLKQAAKDGGTELGLLAKAFEKLDIAREKALSGSKEGLKLLARFGQLGISQEDLQTKTAANLFMGPLRDRANSMSPEDLGAILHDVLGKGFGQLIPVLQTDFEALEKKIRGLGGIMEGETAAKLKTFGDSLDLLTSIIAVHFAPTVLHIIEELMGAVSKYLGWLDDRSRLSTPDEKPKGGAGTGSTLWNLSGTVGSGIMGGISGVLGLADEAFGDKEKAEDRLIEAMEWFKRGGISGGWMEDAADAMNASLNNDKPGLKPAWDNIIAQWKEDAAKLAARLKTPPGPEFNVPLVNDKEPKEKPSKAFHERGDELLRVGNFLGSSRSVLEDIGQKQVQLLQQIANNTKPRSAFGSGYAFSDDDFVGV